MAVVATEDGRFLEPTQGAPSTHIVKVGNANDEVLVENEFVVMKTAFALRLPVVSCNIGRAGDIPYLVVPRIDREIEGNLVRRIHQEDVCQALGLPTSMKYEFAGDVLNPDRMASLANLFKIGRKSADPLTFFQDVLKVTFFNFLVGNADAHAKNFALLHTAAKPRLAPFYDLVCISMYPDISQDLAMTIGQQTDWQRVEAEHWTALLQSAGVKPRIMNTLFKPLAEKIIPAMRSVIENNGLSGSRVSLVLDCVGERIGHLNRTLGWAITVDPDAFVVSGGGWALD